MLSQLTPEREKELEEFVRIVGEQLAQSWLNYQKAYDGGCETLEQWHSMMDRKAEERER